MDQHSFAYGKHVLSVDPNYTGSRYKTSLYTFNNSFYTEGPRVRSSPYVSSGLKRVFFKSAQLDAEAGIVNSSTISTHQMVDLDYSDDLGNTWSTPVSTSAGEVGEYTKRIIWRRLGNARSRVFRVTILVPDNTPPVGRMMAIKGFEMDLEVGNS